MTSPVRRRGGSGADLGFSSADRCGQAADVSAPEDADCVFAPWGQYLSAVRSRLSLRWEGTEARTPSAPDLDVLERARVR